MNLRIKRVGTHDLPLPAYAKPGDAGLDLRARIDGDAAGRWYSRDGALLTMSAGERVIIPCGFAFEIPDRLVGLIQDRSSMAAKGVKVAGGVIDAGFRGEPSVILINTSSACVSIRHGDKIAQMIILRCPQVDVLEVNELSTTERGANGFGSTGVA